MFGGFVSITLHRVGWGEGQSTEGEVVLGHLHFFTLFVDIEETIEVSTLHSTTYSVYCGGWQRHLDLVGQLNTHGADYSKHGGKSYLGLGPPMECQGARYYSG